MKKCKSYEVKLHIGSVRGYHGQPFTKEDLIAKIGKFQEPPTSCSVRVTPTTFVFRDYVEEGFEVVAQNYPRFPKENKNIRKFMRGLAKFLLVELEQNRITVTDPKKSIMFESEHAEANP